MVAISPQISKLLTTIFAGLSIYCEQYEQNNQPCTVITKYYHPMHSMVELLYLNDTNPDVTTVYGIRQKVFATNTLEKEKKVGLFYPENQNLVYTLEEEKEKKEEKTPVAGQELKPINYTIHKYPPGDELFKDYLFPSQMYQMYDFCFSLISEFYCIRHPHLNAKNGRIYRRPYELPVPVNSTNSTKKEYDEMVEVEDLKMKKLKIHSFDYCTQSLIMLEEYNQYLYYIGLYATSAKVKADSHMKVNKSNYKANICLHPDGRLRSSPIPLSAFMTPATPYNGHIPALGMVDFEICTGPQRGYTCPAPSTAASAIQASEDGTGFFNSTANIIWLVFCIILFIADVAAITFTVIYWKKKPKSKEPKEMGTETYLGLTDTSNKRGKKKQAAPVMPPPQLSIEPAVTKPQSTQLHTNV